MRRLSSILASLASLASLALIAGVAAPARAQVRDVPAPDTLGANFRHDSVGTATPTDFDFLDGRWDIRFQARKSPTEFWPARAGSWSARRTHDGLVIEDEFSLIDPA